VVGADVSLIPGHRIYIDLVARQNILPSQPPATHDDSGRGSHSSNLDNDGSSSISLQNEDQQNDQENVFSDTDNTVNSNQPINDQNGQAGSGSSDTTTQSGVSSSDSSDTPSGSGVSSVSSDTSSSDSSSNTTTQSSISNSGSSDTPSGVGNISSDTWLSVSSSNSSLLEIEESASSNFSQSLAVLVTVLNTLNEEDDIDINEESDIETFLCTVVHLTRRN
jgi:hypothetical protein